MQDFRSNKTMFKGSFIKTAGYNIDETSVKEMLTFLGVSHDEEMVQDAIGYFLTNSMGITMSSVEEYLKGKQIVSKLDMRKKN